MSSLEFWDDNLVTMVYNLYVDGYSYEDITSYLSRTEYDKVNFPDIDKIIDLVNRFV